MVITRDAGASSFPRGFFTVLRRLRALLFVSVAAALFYGLPQQTLEIYRAIAQDTILRQDLGPRYIELLFAVAGLLALCICMWVLAARLLAPRLSRVTTRRSSALKSMVQLMPPLLALIVLAGCVIGVLRARTNPPSAVVKERIIPSLIEMLRLDTELGGISEAETLVVNDVIEGLFTFNERLTIAAIVMIIVAVLAFAALRNARIYASVKRGRFRRALFEAREGKSVLVFVAGLLLLFSISQVSAPVLFGPLVIVALFFLCMACVMTQLADLADRHGVPYLGLTLLLVVVIGVTGTNDNHRVSELAHDPKAASTSSPNRPTLSSEFRQWYLERPDRAFYEAAGKPYPIYVVAAQGGGIYAALNTATVLGRLQDQCPSFNSHLFAISSVSGGSLGAAIYSGLAKQIAPSPFPCLEKVRYPYKLTKTMSLVEAADMALSRDLLAPLFSGLLFSDLLQRFIPGPIGFLDRGRRLDAAFSNATQSMISVYAPKFAWPSSKNFLAEPYLDHWKANAGPALVFNSTQVGSGQRRVTAPFEFPGEALSFVPLWPRAPGAPSVHISLATAAGLSARFPWISPPGGFDDVDATGNVKRVDVVDGGYFENSGVATAADIIRSMRIAAAEHGFSREIAISLIVLTGWTYADEPPAYLRELQTPLQTLMNTRVARGYISIADAQREFALLSQPQPLMRRVKLLDMDYPLPLGWRLSTITSLLIRAQAGDPRLCASATPGAPMTFEADCLLESVYRELTGT